MKKIADTIFYQSPDPQYDQPCLYAIMGKEKTLMIDGGVSAVLAKEFTAELRRDTGRGIDFVALTHWHWDHVFGLSGLDAPVIACKNTAAHLKRMAGYASWDDDSLDARVRSKEEIFFCAKHIKITYPGNTRNDIIIHKPDIVFSGVMTIHLGGLTCELLPLPAVHTNDCIAIYVPEEHLLFVGDSTGQNSYDQPAYYSAPAVLKLFEYINNIDARLIMESHSEPATPAEFIASNQIIIDAASGVQMGLQDKTSLMKYMKHADKTYLPDDIEEVAELFIAGLKR